MKDASCAMLYKLLAEYCEEYASPGEWDVRERRAFTDLANDLRESCSDDRFTFKQFPSIV